MAKAFLPHKRDVDQTRFAAIDYVNQLETAPDGSRITSTERNVLKSLAQWIHPALGFAWPSMKRLAKRCSISERHCRRTIERLERKGVIARVHMRGDHGSQTSNEYFFPALGTPKDDFDTQQARLRLQRVPRTRMAPGVGRKRPRKVVTLVPQTRTNASEGPGHQRPPIESLKESVIDSLGETEGGVFKASAAKQAEVQTVNFEKAVPDKARVTLSNIEIGRMAWESALRAVRKLNGAKEFRTHSFLDVRVSEVRANSDRSVTIELRSPNPEKSICGLQKFQEIIARALRNFYGCRVRLACVGEDTDSN